MNGSFNAKAALSALGLGYVLAEWGSLFLPAFALSYVFWSSKFCADWLVLGTVYLGVLQEPLAVVWSAVKSAFGLGAKAAVDIVGVGVKAAGDAAVGVVSKVDVP